MQCGLYHPAPFLGDKEKPGDISRFSIVIQRVRGGRGLIVFGMFVGFLEDLLIY